MSDQQTVCARCGGPFGDQETPGRTGQGEPCHACTLTCVEVLRRQVLVMCCAFCGTEFPRDQPNAMSQHMLTCDKHPIARAAAVTLSTLTALHELHAAADAYPGPRCGPTWDRLEAALQAAGEVLARWRECAQEEERP